MWRPVCFAIALLLIGVGLASLPTRAQDPVQILNIDLYARTIAPTETTSFNWTVRNIDSVAYDIRIDADALPGWTVEADPSFIQNLTPNRAAGVTVSVTAPEAVYAELVLDVRVVFTVSQDGATVFVDTRSATVTIPAIFAEKRFLGLLGNPLPAPLNNEWGVFLLDIVFWLALSVAVTVGLMPLLRKIGKRTKVRIAEHVFRLIRTPVLALLFLYGTLQSFSALDRHIDATVRGFLFEAYQIALSVVIFYLVYRLFKDVVINYARTISKKTESGLGDVIVPIAEKLGLAVIGLAALGLLLGYLNVDLTLFIAGGVVTSLVIAFAAQDTLSNFFSGIFLLADRPFREGDIVILSDGDWAEVRKIGMRTTRLFRFSDASIVTLPNNKLVNDKIANFSNPDDKGRVMKTFNVAYGSDIGTVKRILQEVIGGSPHIIQTEPCKPIVRFDAMSESSLDFFVLVWIDDRARRFDVLDYLNTEIYRRFSEAGIEIPFPQRTVHLRMERRTSQLAPGDLEEITRRVAMRERDETSQDDNDKGPGHS